MCSHHALAHLPAERRETEEGRKKWRIEGLAKRFVAASRHSSESCTILGIIQRTATITTTTTQRKQMRAVSVVLSSAHRKRARRKSQRGHVRTFSTDKRRRERQVKAAQPRRCADAPPFSRHTRGPGKSPAHAAPRPRSPT